MLSTLCVGVPVAGAQAVNPRDFAVAGVHLGMPLAEARARVRAENPDLKLEDLTAVTFDGKTVAYGFGGRTARNGDNGSKQGSLDAVVVVATLAEGRVSQVVRERWFPADARPALVAVKKSIEASYGNSPLAYDTAFMGLSRNPEGVAVYLGYDPDGKLLLDCRSLNVMSGNGLLGLPAYGPGNLNPGCGVLLHIQANYAYRPDGYRQTDVVGVLLQRMVDTQSTLRDRKAQQDGFARLKADQEAAAAAKAAAVPPPKM